MSEFIMEELFNNEIYQTPLNDDLYFFATLIAKHFYDNINIFDYYGEIDLMFVKRMIKPIMVSSILHDNDIELNNYGMMTP